ENPDSTLYVKSDIWSFRIGSGDTTHHDTTHHDTTAHADTGACADNCSAPTPTNTTPSTRTFHVGDTITVGKFHMILTTVTGTGSSLNGEGTIQVPYLHAPIEVTFTGISVNTDNQMYGSGKIDAKQSSASPISAATANNMGGGSLGLDTTQIKNIANLAGQAGRLVSALTMSSPIDLPLGFDDTISGNHYVIAIVGMEWSATDANLNAAMGFAIPDLGPGVGLGLGAKDICFHPEGIGGNGKATLYLVEDLGYVDTNSNSWGFVFKAPTTGDSGTYISFDCHGFKELRLAADIQFPRSWFTPVPENGNHVFGHLRATITKAGDWIAGATLDDCAIAGAPGFTLQVQNMVFDHSDVQNPPGMTFPHGFSGDTGLTWHGFYIQTAKITLPPELTTFDSSHPPTIAVNNLMIGSGGFCANIRAFNIIHYPQGNFGDWGASIDTIGVDFVSSSLTQGFISGQIKIPISDSSLIYRATLSHPGGDTIHFEFVIQPKDTINCNLWLATLHLNPSSRIQLDNDSGSFRAFADLSGSITLNGNIGSIPMSFIGVDFTDFKVMTNSPYIDIGHWSFASDQHSTDGFPVSISNIGMVTGTRSGGAFGVGVQFTLTVNFTSGGDGIGGAATMSIWGKLATGGGPMSFQFDGVDLDSIGVNADLGAVEIDGGVRIYHTDPTFGDGFRGNLHANFLHEVDIYATAQFGNVNGYRYWYVDARALFATGIPIFTGVGFYGFGGGAWYHMRRQTVTDPPAPTSTAVASSTTPGATVSGYTFVPDQTTELGLRAMITLGTYPTPDAFNADVFFEVSFLSGGGVGEISIGGNGYMMASVANRSSAPVTASVLMTYDFP
ncbi:MAG TPA: hypothetical protein VFJ29_06285, partial [Candidatus Kapabacteria bacterium]|nr:hypothetical protein [Candidatus Kapabacteria bacterium]